VHCLYWPKTLKEHLHEWVAVEAYEGSVEALRAYVKQRLLQFVNGEGYHLGIWYQDALVGVLDYRLNWRRRKVELGYWIDATIQGKGKAGFPLLRKRILYAL
jgi:ribosomal-protein-serine acetyltransferase